eukprot:TRINITY_DN15564_c0_g2_i1.p1 TRINITY_DN15564_c0_g2~~TRINITY_DN15564_c0_g2_i1.p1  ORF type:complete len:519 (+),score=110.92 TRINITY_DN15564_c0_g2_i1:46-1557(+)
MRRHSMYRLFTALLVLFLAEDGGRAPAAAEATAVLRREQSDESGDEQPNLEELTRRLARALRPFEHEYLSSLAEASGEDQPLDGEKKHGTPEKVWLAFRDAMDAALKDPSLHLNKPYAVPREDNSIYISIASYRDPSCSATVRNAFEKADRPELVSVGVVQQNCGAKRGCFTGTGWADTRRWVPSPPDPDCLKDFCASALGAQHCRAGRVRALRLPEDEAYGPMFSRYLNAKLWRGETYFMQIDSHSGFREGWDSTLIEMMKQTPSFPRSVISSYPPSGEAEDTERWRRSTSSSEKELSGLCGALFEDTGEETFTLRMAQSTIENHHRGSLRPPYATFVAAGFMFGHASLLREVPPDPFLPYIFMGEEIAMSLRLYTAGFDIYAPSVDVIRHHYVRKEHPKFWETVNMVFSGDFHNALNRLLVRRVLHLLGRRGVRAAAAAAGAPDVFARLSEYGLGRVRTLDQFMEMAGLDVNKKEMQTPEWCERGRTPPHALGSGYGGDRV